MSFTAREARQLTTVAEWPLVESSLPAKIRQLSPARLKAKIERARKMRAKYADLVKRQHRKAQSKRSGQPNEKLNARTKRKAALFGEVLARYESAAKNAKGRKSDAKSPKSAKSRKSAAKSPKGRNTAKRTSAKGPATQTGSEKVAEAAAASAAQAAMDGATTVAPPQKVKETRAPLVPKSSVHTRTGQHRIHAHVSSRGRRRQGRRDNR